MVDKNLYEITALTKQPKFSEGEFSRYVAKTIQLPKIKDDLEVRVYVNFVVDTDGSVSDVKVLRDPGFGLGKEVARAVKSSPKWEPGEIDGKPVRVSYTLPVVINIKA